MSPSETQKQAERSKTELSQPRDVGCGTIQPVRASSLAAIYYYDYNPRTSPRRVDDKVFDFNCLLVTNRGTWKVRGVDNQSDIDGSRIVTGVAGHGYGCSHNAAGNSSYIVTLANNALDPNCGPLFAKQIIPSAGALGVIGRACGAANDDAFDSIVFTFFGNAAAISARKPASALPRLRMQRVKRFIENHAFEQLRLVDISSEVGLSSFALVHQFREATGKTPYAYLLDIRLARARRLLETTSDSIREVANTVGFLDQAHFSKFFKAGVGCSASAYRSIQSSQEVNLEPTQRYEEAKRSKRTNHYPQNHP